MNHRTYLWQLANFMNAQIFNETTSLVMVFFIFFFIDIHAFAIYQDGIDDCIIRRIDSKRWAIRGRHRVQIKWTVLVSDNLKDT